FTVAPGMSTTAVVEFNPSGFGTSSGVVQVMSNGNWLSVPVTGVARLRLSGRIASGDGVGVVGVPVALHGAADATTTTNGDGRYAFLVQPSNGYTVTPTDSRATFAPPTR